MNSVKSTLDFFGIRQVFGSSTSKLWTKLTCKYLPDICYKGQGNLITQNYHLDDPKRFQVMMGHFPAGASVQSFLHFGQLVKAKKFQLFDHGKRVNMKVYGQSTPPEIDLKRIKSLPIAMFVGTQDHLGDVTDNRWARDEI